jgi:purine-binding chemotaxis protein CheW
MNSDHKENMAMESSEKHLVFRIKDQLFTLHVVHVNTIIQLPRLFKVPQSPEFIVGVINVEGDVIPVIDTAKKMTMGEIEVGGQSQVIIMQHQLEAGDKMHLLGFLVDEVCEVSDVESRKIQALPTSKYEFDERLVDGMHKIEGEFCMQINIANFFKGDIEDMLENQKTLINK